jgi:(2Fe-2S) ferredoxin
VCRGQYCNMDRRADKLLAVLEPQVDAFNDAAGWRRCKLETANCLGMCGLGPNVVIYPDDVTFNHLAPDDAAAVMAALESVK